MRTIILGAMMNAAILLSVAMDLPSPAWTAICTLVIFFGLAGLVSAWILVGALLERYQC